MNLLLLTDEDLSPEEAEALWAQGVNLDDTDVLIFVPPDAVTDQYAERDSYAWRASDEGPCWPTGPYGEVLDRLLDGVYDNRWYRVTFRGALYGLGVAYHA